MHTECWPPDLAEHVKACPACAELARDLRRLEDDWRHLPLPAEAEHAKAEFVQKLPVLRARLLPPRSRVKPAIRWATAAMLLVGVGLFLWTVGTPGTAAAAPDLVDKLIAWNLALNKADPEERKRLLDLGEAAFQNDLLKARLAKDQRDLAERLLVTGRWIATNDDPIVEAGKLSDIVDNLVSQIDDSSRRGDVGETKRWVVRYSKMERGFHHSIKRAGEMNKGWGADKKKAFEQMREQHEKWQREQFQKMNEHAAPQIKKMFESMKTGQPPFPVQGNQP